MHVAGWVARISENVVETIQPSTRPAPKKQTLFERMNVAGRIDYNPFNFFNRLLVLKL